MIRDTRALRTLMQSDPYRPIYHFVAPEGVAMPFDPNGAIFWKGKYHLGFIYQKRPTQEYSATSGHVWGHAVSTDLLHWSLYPDMLDVQEGGREIGIFSGGAFLSREGIPHIIYHSLGAGANVIAAAEDVDLKFWKRLPGKPALSAADLSDPNETNGMRCCIAPPDARYSVFDPEAWYDQKADVYYMISGGMKPGLFKSRDLHKWKYAGELVDRNRTMREPLEDISCPDFFSLGSKSMLLFISHKLGAQYYIGTFANDRFSPEQHGRMNWPGGTFFAPEQLQDGQGRNIIWGWIVEEKPADLPDYGWSGIMSLPRIVSLGEDGKLRISPPEELKSIRLEATRDDDLELAPHTERTLNARGKSIELQLEFATAASSSAGVKVLASADGREETRIFYDPLSRELVIDFSRSSAKGATSNLFATADPRASRPVSQQRAPLELKDGETLSLDIFLDRSVIEVFANGTQCITQVVYPELATSTAVKVYSGNEAVRFRNIKSWSMAETNAY
jgi:beta-fructofuranosidase